MNAINHKDVVTLKNAVEVIERIREGTRLDILAEECDEALELVKRMVQRAEALVVRRTWEYAP